MNANWTDILWYLAIGGLFILMMRGGGCCGGHGQKKAHDKQSGAGHQP